MVASRVAVALIALVALTTPGGCATTDRRPATAPTAASPAATISIVGTSDLHGRVLPEAGRGGLALLGGYVEALRAARARDGGAVILLDAGDMFQGTLESNLTEGASVIAAYNSLGYAAAAIGNHEFDFGPVGAAATPQRPDDDPRGALKDRAAEARFPFLTANIVDAATGRPVDWPNVQAATMITAAGIRVGLVGAITAQAFSATTAANTVGLRVAPLAGAVAAAAARLRAEGASVVVVAAHAGGRCVELTTPADLSSCEPSAEIMQVARELPQGLVDVIVAGHSHAGVAHEVNGIAITQAYSNGRAFGRVDVLVDRAAKQVLQRRIFPPRDLCARVDPGTDRCDPDVASPARVAAVYEGAAVRPDSRVAAVLAPAVKAAAALKAAPLGVLLETPIRRAGIESPLGNLFTDAFLAAIPGADVAINNTGGALRTDLPAGPLTYGAVFEVMPFDNRLVTTRLTARELRRALELHVAGRFRVGVAGLRVRVACRGGTIEAALLRADGAPVRDDESLLVVTTDFLATGGDQVFTPVTPPGGLRIEQDAGDAREVVVAWLKARGGTLREEQLIDPVSPRWVLPGPTPLTCS